MKTNNYKQCLLAMGGANVGDIVLKRHTGTEYDSYALGSNDSSLSMMIGMYYIDTVLTSWSQSGVIFGDGDTEPTEDDYTLSGNIITGIAYTSKVTRVIENNKNTRTVTYTITNNNSESITIKEIGYVGYAKYNSGYAYSVLLDRELLENPITIEAGGVGQITYTVTIGA